MSTFAIHPARARFDSSRNLVPLGAPINLPPGAASGRTRLEFYFAATKQSPRGTAGRVICVENHDAFARTSADGVKWTHR